MISSDVQLMIDKICRSCMCEKADMNNVFEKAPRAQEENVLISDMLMACAHIEVSLGDGLPYLLCSTCKSKLDTAFEFKTQCEKSDNALRELTNQPSKRKKDEKLVVKPDVCRVLSDSEEDNEPLINRRKSEGLWETDSLSCKYCHKTLPGKRALKVHTRLHKDDGTRYCPVCPSKYTRLNPLLKHMKKHDKNGKKFTCAICSVKYYATEDLYNHLNTHKDELTLDRETEKVKPIKVKIEVKEENDDVQYHLAHIAADKSSEEIRIEIEGSKKLMENDVDSMDIPLNQFPLWDNDAYDNDTAFSDSENNIFKKRKRGRPRTKDSSNNKGFPCSECGKVLRTNLGLRIHLKTHGITLEPRWKKKKNKLEKDKGNMKQVVECEFCDRKFKYKKSYSQHMRLEHGMSDEEENDTVEVNNQKIGEADHSTTSNNNEDDKKNTVLKLNKGELIKIPNGPKEEPKDQRVKTAKSELLDEIINGDNVQDENVDLLIESKVKKIHECQVCGKQFERANHLTRHMTLHCALLTHKCDMCDQSFHNEQMLKKHLEEQHINKPYNCTICNKSFTRGEHLIRHLKVHKADVVMNLKCSICELTFSRSDHLARHTKTHLMQDKRHVCLECGKAFNRLDNLKTHQRVHTGLRENSKLHLCVYCGKEFNNSSNMIVHMRRHTGERPYKCSVCDKGFPRSHDLKCHERTHSGEKPYLCTLCGKSFNKSNKLLRHSRVHTGERPYVCNICGRAFTQSNDLALHMRRHTGARPYACGVCPARFIQSGQLKNHRRTTGHWMETLPDLKGGHRVEQIPGPVEPIPIKFKKYSFPPKKEVEEDINDEIHDTVEIVIDSEEQENNQNQQQSKQPHKVLMGIMGNIKLSENEMQSLLIDSGKLVELQGGGYGIMTLPSTVIQGANGEEIKLKTELGTFSLENVEEDVGKEEIVNTSESFSHRTEAYSGVSTSTTYSTGESFAFQTFN